jgi:hypothetical protein
MSVRQSRRLWAIVGIGLAIQIVLAFAYYGPFHVTIEHVAAARVRAGEWRGIYEGPIPWAYPPLFVGWLAGASWLSDVSGLSFHGLAKLGPVLADVGLTLAVYVYLGWRGAIARWRLAGAALVMLGPSFIATSAYHGQIDAVAILPAVIGLMLWERRPSPRRGIEAGLLIGLGTAVKTVPLLMLLPLAVSARSWRERALLVASALVIPGLVLVPFWAAGIDLHRVTGYTGVPGWGGLSLVLHPALGWHLMTPGGAIQHVTGFSAGLQEASRWITAATLVAYTAFIVRFRPALIDAAVLLWLAIFAFSPNFFSNYLVWALPFFIMAGYLVETAALQVFIVVPTVAYYLDRWPPLTAGMGVAYVPFMFGLWLMLFGATVALAARIVGSRISHRRGTQPPLVDLVRAGAGSSG